MSDLVVTFIKAAPLGIPLWPTVAVLLMLITYILRVRNRTSIIILGLILCLAAIPTTIGAMVSIGGCCGGAGNDLLGYVVGIAPAVIGILFIIFSKKLSKHK